MARKPSLLIGVALLAKASCASAYNSVKLSFHTRSIKMFAQVIISFPKDLFLNLSLILLVNPNLRRCQCSKEFA